MAFVYQRRILDVVRRRMGVYPVVLLEGPRTVGKSTLLRELAASSGAEIIDLDDPASLRGVEDDPHRCVAGPRPILFDEHLRFPPLLQYIKAQLNEDGSPGQFVLTGSARRIANREGMRALVGRVSEIPVLPLAQAEVEGRGGNFVEEVFEDIEQVLSSGRSRTARDSYTERVLAGGFPLPLLTGDLYDREQRFDDYLRQSLEYGFETLYGVREPQQLRLLLNRYAAQTGQLLNIAKAAGDVGLKAATAENYTRLLELIFVIHLLPAWRRTDRGPIPRPKVYAVDSGVGGRLLRLGPEKIRSNDPLFLSQYGNLLETFVVGEIRKMLSWTAGVSKIGYWRNRRGAEVDLVVERPDDDAVVGVEVKSSSKVSRSDWRGLRVLRDELGPRFRAGLVMYMGGMPYRLDDRIYALPIDKLWGGGQDAAIGRTAPGRVKGRAAGGGAAVDDAVIGRGVLTAAEDPLPEAVRAAAEEMIARMELDGAAYWELAAAPSDHISFDDFYTPAGVYGELQKVDWIEGVIEPIDQCLSIIEKGKGGVLIHPLGSMTVVLAGAERVLCWPSEGYSGHAAGGFWIVLDGNLVHMRALWAAEFVHRVLAPNGPSASWICWSAGRHLRRGRPRLSADLTSIQGVLQPREAVVDDPLPRGIPLAGNPEAEALALRASFYEWFGVPAAAIR